MTAAAPGGYPGGMELAVIVLAVLLVAFAVFLKTRRPRPAHPSPRREEEIVRDEARQW